MNKLKALAHFICPFREYQYKKASFALVFVVYVLGFIGVYLISVLQDSDENLYQKQMIAYLAGFFLVLLVGMIDYHFIAKLYIVLYLIGIGLLLICKYLDSPPIYGWAHYDARRWIKIGGDPSLGINNPGFEFQPSEITKLTTIIFIAKLFTVLQKYIKKFWVLALAIATTAIPIYFIFDQPDLSTTLVMLAVFCIMVLISGVSYKFIIPTIVIGAPTLYGLFWYVQQDFQTLLDKYQRKRILAALHPELYPELAYQQTNAVAAIKSGGMLGKTITGIEGVRGTRYVPVKESDFIYTAVAEEFGFIGSLVVIILYLIMILLIIRIARRAKDFLGMMIATGFGALILLQVFVNIGVVSALLPNTGIPLPFMSSGLSSLLVNLIMLGILLNISLQPKAEEKQKNEENEDELGYLEV